MLLDSKNRSIKFSLDLKLFLEISFRYLEDKKFFLNIA